jgi:hypothetical protein
VATATRDLVLAATAMLILLQLALFGNPFG